MGIVPADVPAYENGPALTLARCGAVSLLERTTGIEPA